MNTKYRLRGLELEDLDSLFAIENDSNMWKYSNRSSPYTKAFLTEYILQSHLPIQEAQQLRLALVDDINQAKGFVDLFEVDLHHQRAGVGIAIHPKYQNQGLGSVGLSLLLDYCHSYLSLHQLYCDIDEKNKESIRLFEKAGFEQTGLKKDWNFYEKEFHSVRMYQKIEL